MTPESDVRGSAHLCLGAAFVALFALHCFLRHGIYDPMVIQDEFGYLGNAAMLAGYDWTGAIARVNSYYSFGFSLLLVPFLWVSSGSEQVYQSALLLNSLLTSSIVFPLYGLARHLAPALRPHLAVAAAVTTALYPMFLIYASLAWCESLLVAVFVWTVFVLSRLSTRPSGWASWLGFAVLAGSLYSIHHRGIGALAAAALAVLYLRAKGHATNSNLVVFGLGLGSVLAGTVWFDALLVRWAPRAGRSAIGLQVDPLATLLGFPFLSFAQKAVGQSFYLTAATYFAYPVGLLASAYLLIRGHRIRGPGAMPPGPEIHATVIYAAGTMLATATISALFLANGTRPDHTLYGRYNEAFLAPILLIGLLGSIRAWTPSPPWGLVLAASLGGFLVLAGALDVLAGEHLATGQGFSISMTSFFAHRGGGGVFYIWPTVWWFLPLASGVLLLARWVPLAALTLLSLLFLHTADLNVSTQLKVVARSNAGRGDVYQWLRERDDKWPVYFLLRKSWLESTFLFRWQFWLMREPVVPLHRSELPSLRRLEAAYVITVFHDRSVQAAGGRLMAVDPHAGSGLWVVGERAQQALARSGVRWLEPDEPPRTAAPTTPRPPSDYLARLEMLSPEPVILKRMPQDPSPAAAGTATSVRVRVTNAGEHTRWSPSVRLGIHWFARDAKTRRRIRETRLDLPRPLKPGEQAVVEVPLAAVDARGEPLPPGDYELIVSLVERKVGWFHHGGTQPLRLRARVVED